MHAQDFSYHGGVDNRGQLDNIELLKTVDSLRQDILSMSTDIRDVLSENENLHREIDQLKERRRGNGRISEAQRIKSEVDDLIRMHEATSSGKDRSRRIPRKKVQVVEGERINGSEWMKKMMMFMMMAEMV
jgi:regulator of replication initiation timing